MAIIVAVAGVAYVSYNSSATDESSLIMQNIEALVDSEDEEGTPISDCYTSSNSYDGSSDFVYHCDSRTTTEMIYNCPDRQEWLHKGMRGSCVRAK